MYRMALKRLTGIMLLVVMAVFMTMGLSFGLTADAAADTWNGSSIAPSFAGGVGTTENPYQIATGAQLAYLAQQVNAKNTTYNHAYYKLTADIDLNNNPWTPIGVLNSDFYGCFDGDGHKISNLAIGSSGTPSTLDYAGLFGNVGSTASASVSITNTGVENVSIYNAYSGTGTSSAKVGGLAGYFKGGTATNCYTTGTIVCSANNAWAGGLIGRANPAAISNCYSTVNVTGGGCTGYNIEGNTAQFTNAGGLVGRDANDSPSTITNCFATGTVTGGDYAKVGGLVGYLGTSQNNNNITNCYASGTATGGANAKVGGLVGEVITGVIQYGYWNSTANSIGVGSGTDTSTSITSDDFGTLLNTNRGSNIEWKADAENKNGGYPILTDIGVGKATALAPTVTTSAASSITSTGATLNGLVNANGISTTVTFECGLTTEYGTSVTATQSPVTGSTATAVSYTLSGLTPSTTYHYRIKGVNTGGTTTGDDITFTTSAAIPMVVENFSDEITDATTFSNSGFSFNLTGGKFAVANYTGYGWTGTTSDDYYLDNYGNYPASAGVLGSITISSATFKVGDLYIFPGETGDYVANTGTVIIRGKLGGSTQFTYTVTSGDIQIFGGEPNANGWTYVNLSAYSSYTIDQLEFEVTGALRYLAIDAFKHVSTAPIVTPTVTTTAASFITTNGATLNGTVNANSSSTVVTFEYGFTTAYGTSVTASQSPVTGSTATNVSYVLTGLTPSTTYHYRVVGGTTNGSDQPFTTLTAAPTVTGISPSSGPTDGGTSVTITGTNFTGAVAVKFGSTNATGYTVDSATQITATAPTGSAGTVNITVTTAGGTSSTGAADQFAFVAAPVVSSVTVPSNGVYKTGDTLNFSVKFNQSVAVTGIPVLNLILNNGGTVQASYVSGSDSSDLTFSYMVVSGNLDNDGITVDTLSLNSGTIRNGSGTNADLTLNSVSSTGGVLVDAVAPTITSISAPGNGTYIAGQNLDYTVNFTEAVNVVTTGGTPYVTLTVGSTSVLAAYVSGSGTNALVFRYTVITNDLDYNGVEVSSNITANGGTIKDAAGNSATLTFTGATAPGVLVDAVAPTVSSVSVPANGTYSTGQNLDFTVNFSKAVTVNTTGGIPAIAVTLDTGGAVSAGYVSSSGTSALVFRYTIAAGNSDTTGITVGGLSLNGATLKDLAGNNATLTLNNVGSTVAVLVDAVAPTVTDANIFISGATGTGGAYKTGDTITAAWNNTAGGDNNADTISSVTIDFSAFGGGAAVAATNNAGTWSANYTITAGAIDATNRNVAVTATDNAGNATTTADTSNAAIDNMAPTITDGNISISGATGSGGAYKTGDTVTAAWNNTAGGDNNADTISGVTIDFSAFGGGAAVAATNSAGTWRANYIITAGAIDTSNRNVAVTATDNVGNATTTADTSNATVDNIAPTVIITAGTTAGGDAVVNAAEKTAGFNVVAQSSEASGTLYVVPSGTANNIGAIISASIGSAASTGANTDTTIAISVNNAGVTDATVYKVYAVDGAGNISAISGTAFTTNLAVPAVSSVIVPASGTYITGQNLDFTVNYSEAVTVNPAGGTPYIPMTLDTGGTVNASYVSGSGTNALIFRYAIQNGNLDTDGITVGAATSLNGASIKGMAGNDAELTLNNLGSTASVKVDAVVPVIDSAVRASDNTYIDITCTEGVYGASDGTTALTAGQLALTFSSNGGGATNAVISSIKKNDNVAEGTASALTGGETTVRLFLTLTGTSTGVETIEIRPVNVASIYDAAGNAMAADQTTGCKTLKDQVAPAAGASGTITTSNITASTVQLAWTVATDTRTVQSNLQYKVVYSSSNNITTLADAQSNGTLAKDWTADLAGLTVIALTANNNYFFNVIVKDEAGNMTAYSSITCKTTNGNSGSSGQTTSQSTGQTTTGVVILVNGKTETAATATTSEANGKTVTTVLLDDKKVEEKLNQEGNHSTVTIPVTNSPDVVIGILNGQTVKNMENKEAILEIKTENVTYTLPAGQINIDSVSEKIGQHVALKDVTVSVTIATPAEDTVRIIEDTANKNNYQLVVKPVEFNITCTSGNNTVQVSKFNGYVERTVAIPEGIDPSKITTGVILNNDGTFSHVPTQIIQIGGKYYAKIRSLTNSTYSVIYSPKIFADVEQHWAKKYVNEMGSRLVLTGIDASHFAPDRDITRAEFAAIIVRALGLRETEKCKLFSDVHDSDWFTGSVAKANEYGIVQGMGDGSFKPNKAISRQEAMAMIARAMKIAKMDLTLSDTDSSKQLDRFKDKASVENWARSSVANCVKLGVMEGSNGSLRPQSNITRAETATVVMKMLKQTGLI